MREFNKRKNGWIFILLLLAFGIIITSINLNLFNINSEETILDNKTDGNGTIFDNQDEIERRNDIPQTADQTDNNIHIISKNDTLIRKDGLDQSILFYFNDTNGNPISDLTTDNITVKDNQTGSGDFMLRNGGQGDHNWTLYNITGAQAGYYKLNVSIKGLNSGWIRLELNASYSNNWSVSYIDFYLKGNSTSIKIKAILDPGGHTVTKSPITFIETNITVHFIMNDTDYNNNSVLDKKFHALYSINYYKIDESNVNGTLSNDFRYYDDSETYKGKIVTASLPKIGRYNIKITINLTNYEILPSFFNITIIDKFFVNITVIELNEQVLAGETITLIIIAKYIYGSTQIAIEGALINVTLYANGVVLSGYKLVETDENGTILFSCFIPIDAINLTLDVEIESGYYYKSGIFKNMNISVIPFINLFLPFILFIGTAVGILFYLFIIYRDEFLPKKYERVRILTEFKEIYDNVINLEKIIVLYKRTGTCIFFKSLELAEIDPKQIKELLSVISSFGKDLVSQEKINEITHENKIFLLSDGKFIRVALVLKNKPSIALCNHLDAFLNKFEKIYEKDLLNWRYQLNLFRDTEQIIDEIFNTSIIIPHEINKETSSLKDLKNQNSKDILEIARELERDKVKRFFLISTLIEEAASRNRNDIVDFLMSIKDRKFFFINALIEEAVKKIGKNMGDVFIGIKELKEKKILTSIEIYMLNLNYHQLKQMDSSFIKNC